MTGTVSLMFALFLLAGGVSGCRRHPQEANGHPIPHAHIYPEVDTASNDIANGLQTAAREHKRVLLDFGGDWCGDCQVLNIYFHQPENQALLQQHFVLVDVNIGRHIDHNLKTAKRYGVDATHGVPALAVLNPDGSIVHAETGGEFSAMRHMQSSSVHDFLTQWQ